MDTRTREELIAENALLKEKLAALEAEIEMLRDKLSGGGKGSSAAPFIKPNRQQRREAERQERKKRRSSLNACFAVSCSEDERTGGPRRWLEVLQGCRVVVGCRTT